MIALASATVSSAEMSHVSIDDCFAASCLVPRFKFTLSPIRQPI